MSQSFLKISSCLIVSILFFSSCEKNTYAPERVKAAQVVINSNIAPDTTITDFIEPYRIAIQEEMDNELSYSPQSLSKADSKYNTAIGNMMADAVFEMANPIFKSRAGYPFNAVLLNYGGIRSGLNAGPITTRTAYELMPFENEVVVIELSGRQLKQMFHYLSSGTAHPISNMTIELAADDSLKRALIQGTEVLDNETYFIATSDYLSTGGDNMTFFENPVSTLNLDYKIRNVLIDYFKKYDTIAPVADQRFIKLDEQ